LRLKMNKAKSKRIAVTDKHDIAICKPLADMLRLDKHVSGFHIDLIKFTERQRPVHDYIRYGI